MIRTARKLVRSPQETLPILALLLALRGACALQAADWPHWRGPFFNGATEETNLVIRWSRTENVLWSAPLPGPSAATPIVWGDYVFISSTDEKANALVAMAFDRRAGKLLWRREVARGSIRRGSLSNLANPSPVVAGDRAVFLYGNGKTLAFTFGGDKLWERDLEADYGQFAYLWTYGASPTFYDGRLYYTVLQRDHPVRGRGRADGRPIESYLLALDPATGKTLWRVTRPTKAVEESREAYSTPIPFEGAGRKEILVVGGDCITGHDAATGKELWRWGTWNPRRLQHWRLIPSPVAGGGVILACAPKRGPIFALKAGGRGVLDDSALAWTTRGRRDITADVPTPLFYQGDFFILSDLARTLSRIEPRSGRVRWIVKTPGRHKFEASPTGADGRLFLMNFRGETAILDAATGKTLALIPMGDKGDDKTRSSIAVARGMIFIRTNRRLYCVGRPEQEQKPR